MVDPQLLLLSGLVLRILRGVVFAVLGAAGSGGDGACRIAQVCQGGGVHVNHDSSPFVW
jgi:ABC-type transporter Mla maintaining outer membrane lipid asymmetry ATPase subunit MlaF